MPTAELACEAWRAFERAVRGVRSTEDASLSVVLYEKRKSDEGRRRRVAPSSPQPSPMAHSQDLELPRREGKLWLSKSVGGGGGVSWPDVEVRGRSKRKRSRASHLVLLHLSRTPLRFPVSAIAAEDQPDVAYPREDCRSQIGFKSQPRHPLTLDSPPPLSSQPAMGSALPVCSPTRSLSHQLLDPPCGLPPSYSLFSLFPASLSQVLFTEG